jgi:hypothetical protein
VTTVQQYRNPHNPNRGGRILYNHRRLRNLGISNDGGLWRDCFGYSCYARRPSR